MCGHQQRQVFRLVDSKACFIKWNLKKAHIHQTTKNHAEHSDSLTLGIQKPVMNVEVFRK